MASARKLIFGNPPFKVLAGYLAQDKEFLDDVRIIIDLDDAVYDQLATKLEQAAGFLDLPSLKLLAHAVVPSENKPQHLASIVYRVGGMLHDGDMLPLEALKELESALREKAKDLIAEDRQILIDRLQQLVVSPVSLAKQFKARRLVDATGAELEDTAIVCDIRPVFDDERLKIEGGIPLTVLQINYTTADGESLVNEVRISEKQLTKLAEQIGKAKQKLNSIKQLLAQNGLSVPDTEHNPSEDDQ